MNTKSILMMMIMMKITVKSQLTLQVHSPSSLIKVHIELCGVNLTLRVKEVPTS
jgi:hypothetical protein